MLFLSNNFHLRTRNSPKDQTDIHCYYNKLFSNVPGCLGELNTASFLKHGVVEPKPFPQKGCCCEAGDAERKELAVQCCERSEFMRFTAQSIP